MAVIIHGGPCSDKYHSSSRAFTMLHVQTVLLIDLAKRL